MDDVSAQPVRRIAAEVDKPVPAGIREIVAVIVTRHAPGVAAVLAYGSCIRDSSLDESLVDLYVLTHGPEHVSNGFFARIACRILPPNVYYAECPHGPRVLRCKYSIMPLQDFAYRMHASTGSPYFWARFAQPSRLVFSADDHCRSIVLGALVQAAATMIAECRRLAIPGDDDLAIFARGLKASYAAELRAERSARADMIANAGQSYFIDLAALFPRAGPPDPARAELDWRRRRMIGKTLSVARLIKAGFTFEGGTDYLAWKIGRHSGEKLVPKAWHRRHPVLSGLMQLPKLLRRGTVR
jgi:hypothetical protein